MDKQCEYGCDYETIDAKCTRCGHPKWMHSPVHPHACVGKYDKNNQHVTQSCKCTGFTLQSVTAGTGI